MKTQITLSLVSAGGGGFPSDASAAFDPKNGQVNSAGELINGEQVKGAIASGILLDDAGAEGVWLEPGQYWASVTAATSRTTRLIEVPESDTPILLTSLFELEAVPAWKLTEGAVKETKQARDEVIAAVGSVGQTVTDIVSSKDFADSAGLVTLSEGDRIYAAAGIPENVMAQQARASKGGGVGVGDRGVIAIRFDDWHADFKANAYPVITRLGLPAGYATISRLDQQSWTEGITHSDIREWNRNGVEFHSHGTDHKDPTPDGDAGIVDQIVNSKSEIESWGVKVQGWMHPGATPVTDGVPYGSSFTQTSDLYTARAGVLVRSTYPVSEFYCHGIVRMLPSGLLHGNDHVTPSDAMPFQSAIDWVDTAIRDRVGVEMMFHCGNIGKPGNITWPQFEELMEHIASARSSGTLEVLTPSGLVFADKTSSRLDLIEPLPFNAMRPSEDMPLGWSGHWLGKSVGEAAGPDGQDTLRFAGDTGSLISRRINSLSAWGVSGETFVVSGTVRALTEVSTVSRVVITDYEDSSRLNLSLTRVRLDSSWTRVYHAFTLPPGTDRINVSIGRNSGGAIEWADLRIDKV